MGLDTSLQRCSVAILRDGVVLAGQSLDMERGHAEHLAPMAAAVLREAGVKVSDLDRVGVVVGPGGFTGVRVALAFARGLVIGAQIPAIAVTSLAALAENVAAEKNMLIAPVIDARRGQVYAGLYASDGGVLVDPFVATPKEALKQLSDKAGEDLVTLVGASEQIEAAVVARLTMAVWPAAKEEEDALVVLEAMSFAARSWGAKGVRDSFSAPGVAVLLAGRPGEAPAGFVIWRNLGEEAEILSLGVAPAHQRRGVGRALVNGLADTVKNTGAGRLFLEVDAGNDPALRLYRAAGFTQYGRRKAYYRDGADAVLMQLML
ncbi:tRNA threonylcarbamoyladenosine biosynthesis protein TsaB (t(6)A37 threonylcarbamoyladenosine biosynthesis protein TsaB) [Durusdinium trenchii]|uniref:tRNA threonylcarbamoyladenosine biosynthesis protein TsaB (T(6)A37 threonylcarbamoyladenosine biosynthesis protein TsaB) n=1 Tax=Durusdinium trenchii TaxID=1381693 RepID=A0ABP0LTE2_9DINO